MPVGLLPLAAELTRHQARSLVLVLLASALGALLSRLHTRVVLPTVVGEIVLGILIGEEVLDLAEVNTSITSSLELRARVPLVPILIDAGILPTPLGAAVLGTGVAGEF